jgi:hypothetical protein
MPDEPALSQRLRRINPNGSRSPVALFPKKDQEAKRGSPRKRYVGFKYPFSFPHGSSIAPIHCIGMFGFCQGMELAEGHGAAKDETSPVPSLGREFLDDGFLGRCGGFQPAGTKDSTPAGTGTVLK